MANKPGCLVRLVSTFIVLGLIAWGINSCFEHSTARDRAEEARRAGLTTQQREEEDRQKATAATRERENKEAAKKSYRLTDLKAYPASTVFAAYEQNEVKADSQLKDRQFAVKGEVEKIGKDLLDTPYVVLKASPLFGVQCMFDDPAEIAKIAEMKPGDLVTIDSVCQGKMGDVLLNKCWVYVQK